MLAFVKELKRSRTAHKQMNTRVFRMYSKRPWRGWCRCFEVDFEHAARPSCCRFRVENWGAGQRSHFFSRRLISFIFAAARAPRFVGQSPKPARRSRPSGRRWKNGRTSKTVVYSARVGVIRRPLAFFTRSARNPRHFDVFPRISTFFARNPALAFVRDRVLYGKVIPIISSSFAADYRPIRGLYL